MDPEAGTGRLPRLSNDGQLMVFGLVKEGMTIDDALAEALRMERAEAESKQLIRSGTLSQRRCVGVFMRT